LSLQLALFCVLKSGFHSVEIETFACVKTIDFTEFFSIKDEIFPGLVDIVEKS